MFAIDRRAFLANVAAGVAAGVVSRDGKTAAPASDAAQRPIVPTGLADPAFRPLPLGAIRPAGWLARQMRIQADGLNGHLDQF